jgi:hypothetical protein
MIMVNANSHLLSLRQSIHYLFGGQPSAPREFPQEQALLAILSGVRYEIWDVRAQRSAISFQQKQLTSRKLAGG